MLVLLTIGTTDGQRITLAKWFDRMPDLHAIVAWFQSVRDSLGYDQSEITLAVWH